MTINKVQRPTAKTPELTTEPQAENPEATATVEKPADQYDFHIRLHGADIDEKLKDAATVAYRLELIPKATMAQLMNLFIAWGLAILKQRWLDRVGYH